MGKKRENEIKMVQQTMLLRRTVLLICVTLKQNQSKSEHCKYHLRHHLFSR